MSDDEPVETNGNLISPYEVAALCGVDYETVRKWMVSGALPFVEVGPRFVRRVYRRHAEAMIRRPDDQKKTPAI